MDGASTGGKERKFEQGWNEVLDFTKVEAACLSSQMESKKTLAVHTFKLYNKLHHFQQCGYQISLFLMTHFYQFVE